ncbi:MAG TPA: L-threonylcarbamoyladenylate synthase [Terriglobales bacterium]|nr:L-threonylcarbamoyladenylate synthase [Terriglobales bacterium]
MSQPPVDPAQIAEAARLIRAGRLVAFPTETVYGLGANALDSEAVARIYAVKRRPATSPLIVHVASTEMAKSLVAVWPDTAERLAGKFWPGPLTLILPTKVSPTDAVPLIVTAGLPTVALRVPAHLVALALIRAAEVPLAAPSANRFTELSPTTAEHVRRGLGNEVDLILDGGPCTVGIESTVLSLADPTPTLLRPGAISRLQLESIIGPIASVHEAPTGSHPSPGMHPRHYSPRTSLLLVSGGNLPDHAHGQGLYLKHRHPPTIPAKTVQVNVQVKIIQMPSTPAEYAAALYHQLHQADEGNYAWIAVDLPPQDPEWEAIHDRLSRAASKL